MPRIIALRPQNVAAVDLGGGTYQIGLDGSMVGTFVAFSLVYWYPPNTGFAFRPQDSAFYQAPWGSTSLVQVPISLAESQADIDKTCAAARDAATEDLSIRRMAEAFELFKNRSARVADTAVKQCVEDAAEVIRAYWKLRAWMRGGMKDIHEIVVKTSANQREGQTLETVLVCCP